MDTTVPKAELLERERRWSSPAGLAALLGVGLFVISIVIQQSAGGRRRHHRRAPRRLPRSRQRPSDRQRAFALLHLLLGPLCSSSTPRAGRSSLVRRGLHRLCVHRSLPARLRDGQQRRAQRRRRQVRVTGAAARARRPAPRPRRPSARSADGADRSPAPRPARRRRRRPPRPRPRSTTTDSTATESTGTDATDDDPPPRREGRGRQGGPRRRPGQGLRTRQKVAVALLSRAARHGRRHGLHPALGDADRPVDPLLGDPGHGAGRLADPARTASASSAW